MVSQIIVTYNFNYTPVTYMGDTIESKIGILDPDGINVNPLTGEPYSDSYRALSKVWTKFPAYESAKSIIQTIRSKQVTLVQSATGSGKTVLIPKYLLHVLNYEGRIAITLPKKMIAKSAAEFSASTLDVKLGDQVGYQYRGESSKSDNTKLLYCTDGTLVSRLITDPILAEFDAVIIDEAHERKVNIDFLLYLLRNVLEKRPTFKLIIMSATIDKNLFESYYSKFSFESIEIGGKTNYPIKSVFLDKKITGKAYIDEGIKIIKNLIKEITDKPKSSKTGSVGILFFVTSILETQDVCSSMSKIDADTNVCISVFSGMSPEQEKLATDKEYFEQTISAGNTNSKIKLIIATNVAESSLTIEGVEYVIDSGLELWSSYDGINRISILEKKLISHAQAKQRMGRTGRTGPGTCYHLYTKDDFDFNMDRFPIPSIRSESITTEILRLLGIQSIGTVDNLKIVLQQFIEPPDPKTVEYDITYLQNLNMIADSKITDYGKICTDLQVEPAEARALIMAYKLYVFREVLAVIVLAIECKHSMNSLFTLPLDILDSTNPNIEKDKKEWLENKFKVATKDFANPYGDIIALLKIFQKFEELKKDHDSEDVVKKWTHEKFIKRGVLELAYKSYNRSKYSLKAVLKNARSVIMNDNTVNRAKVDTDTVYKVLACFMYGYKYNETMVQDKKAKIKYIDKLGQETQIKALIDPVSFMDLSKSSTSSKRALYFTLFKFGNMPVKIKIITYESRKSIELLKAVESGTELNAEQSAKPDTEPSAEPDTEPSTEPNAEPDT